MPVAVNIFLKPQDDSENVCDITTLYRVRRKLVTLLDAILDFENLQLCMEITAVIGFLDPQNPIIARKLSVTSQIIWELKPFKEIQLAILDI